MNPKPPAFPVSSLLLIALTAVTMLVPLPLMLGCSQPTTLTGGGSVIGNPPIAASLQDQQSRPVAYARVSLYRTDSNPASGDTAAAVTQADSGGRFVFAHAAAGTYNIIAAVTEGRFMGITQHITVPADAGVEDTVRAPACVLGPPAALSVPLANLGAVAGDYLYLPGTPVFRRIDAASLLSGTSFLENVPAGIFPVLYRAKAGGGAPANILSKPVTLIAGATTVVGPYQAWKQSKRVFIHTAAGGAGLGGTVLAFPLLVRMDSTVFDFGLAGDSGQDIRFAKADGITPLAYHIVRWGKADAQIWVRLDSVRAGTDSQFIYLFSGRDSVPAQSDGKAVFASADGYAAAWHLGDDPTVPPPAYLDATGFANNGSGIGMTPETRVEGIVGRATALDGKTQSIQVPDAASLRPQSFTFSAWIKADSLGGRILDKLSVGGQDGYAFDTFGGHIRVCGTPGNYSGQSQLPIGRFTHVAATFDGHALRFFLDGGPDGQSDSLSAVAANGLDLRLGSGQDGTGKFHGILDEVQISSIARSADWLKLSYETQKPGSRVVTVR